MEKRITDLTFFKQNSFGDAEIYREFLGIFLKTTPEMISEMKNAIDEADHETISHVAHKLKSNVQSVGLTNVYKLLDVVESNKHLSPEQLRKNFENISETCRIAINEVQAELNFANN